MNTAIIGASGYIGEQLVKLLFRHPVARPTVVTSRKLADTPVEASIPTLRGRTGGLKFTPSDPVELAARDDIDLYFLALPHGAAALFARPLIDAGKGRDSTFCTARARIPTAVLLGGIDECPPLALAVSSIDA